MAVNAMNRTPRGTICGHRWASGVSLGMHKDDAVASLEYDEDLDAIVLLVNDENVERQGIEVIHTDHDWKPLRARAVAPAT